MRCVLGKSLSTTEHLHQDRYLNAPINSTEIQLDFCYCARYIKEKTKNGNYIY